MLTLKASECVVFNVCALKKKMSPWDIGKTRIRDSETMELGGRKEDGQVTEESMQKGREYSIQGGEENRKQEVDPVLKRESK